MFPSVIRVSLKPSLMVISLLLSIVQSGCSTRNSSSKHVALEPGNVNEFDVVRDGHGRIYWVIINGKRVDHVTLHPRCTSIETHPVNGSIRLWTYRRGGGWIGTIGYYTIEDGRVGPFDGILIFPGDGGTDMGRAIMNTVFSNEFLIPFDANEFPINDIIHIERE